MGNDKMKWVVKLFFNLNSLICQPVANLGCIYRMNNASDNVVDNIDECKCRIADELSGGRQ